MKKRPRQRRRLLLVLAIIAAPGLFGAWVILGLPARGEIRALARERPGETALMRQRLEEARREGRTAGVAHAWVPLSRVSSHLLHAVLASEDQRFFGHEGIDWDAVKESVEKNVERRRFWRGGSTLTQQLAKNLFFGTEKTPTRKLRELVVARWLEEDLTKFRILELYVNVIEWGDGIYGCEAAARHWYGRSAGALTKEEAAGLAAMIPNPRRINPRANPVWLERARERVLRLMENSALLAQDLAGLGAAPPPVTRLPEARPVPIHRPPAEAADREAVSAPPR